jgi:hypothetical protein
LALFLLYNTLTYKKIKKKNEERKCILRFKRILKYRRKAGLLSRPKQVWVTSLGGDPGASSSASGFLTAPGLNVKASTAISEADHGAPKLGVLGTAPMVVGEAPAGGIGLGTTQTASTSLGVAVGGALSVGEGPETLSLPIKTPSLLYPFQPYSLLEIQQLAHCPSASTHACRIQGCPV